MRLLVSDSDQIAHMVETMERRSGKIREESLKLCWFMRGGLTYNEAMNLGAHERQIINGIVKENLETTKKTKLPFF